MYIKQSDGICLATCTLKHTFKKKTPWVEILYYWSEVCILSKHNSEIHLVEGCKGFDIGNIDKSMIHSFVDMSKTFGLTLSKTKPLCVVAHPRLQAHFYNWFHPQVYQLMCNYSWHEDQVLLKFLNLL